MNLNIGFMLCFYPKEKENIINNGIFSESRSILKAIFLDAIVVGELEIRAQTEGGLRKLEPLFSLLILFKSKHALNVSAKILCKNAKKVTYVSLKRLFFSRDKNSID